MKNGIDLGHAESATPSPGQHWHAQDSQSRVTACQKLLDQHGYEIDVVKTNNYGEVIVKLRRYLESSERGPTLLDAEVILKHYDPSITIYLQSEGDKNPLRKFRGVVVNDDRS